ncbi:cysteine desulfurase family protein [Capnocytophaga canimorsus]|uniref:cysteine desulfurase family protein n=1 Tax=Capnocytophaga canimorsus TaxID=28188 RepID=UPI0015629399|nr:cysteine desulfurase family protein [Capnocytophaga canimorsus]
MINLPENVYFDNAASTPLLPQVVEQMTEVLHKHYGNPSSTHSYGRTSKTLIEKARRAIAQGINAQPSEIIFTSGGTEANNMILRGCVRDLKIQTIISSQTEHHAVLRTLNILSKEYGTTIQYVNLTPEGDADLQHLQSLLETHQQEKVLVSLMHVNNEIGNILNLQQVSEICHNYGALFHSDTVQSVGHFPLDMQQISADFITASAHKFHGPKGVGFAFIRKNIPLKGFIIGGEQERGIRAGTEALHDIIGLETAFTLAYNELDIRNKQILTIKKYFIKRLSELFPAITFNGQSGELQKSSPTILNVRLPFSAHTLLFHLDIHGIACSKGSACQSGSVQDSHVLAAFLTAEALEKTSLRFSFSHLNTLQQVDYVVEKLLEIVHQEKK